ncbi:MAG: signal peptide peptidase SppA [Bacteroidetes bacterium]|nr:MAG: signal peptide peptidase SppA [Bacteroidota bacterium]
MKNFLTSLLATIVGILIMSFLLILIFAGIIAASTSKEVPDVKENSILVAEFNSPIIDRSDENPFSRLFSISPSMGMVMGLDQILKDLDKAREDENIRGILLRLSAIPAGSATVEEIRNGLLEFKESGKFIYAYGDMYTQNAYYLATVADSIFMTPEGIFLFNGLSAEATFYKKALDKLGIEVQVIRHGTYKSANEPFTREDLSEENREQIEGYVGAIWNTWLEGISATRDIPVEQLNRYADGLVFFDNKELVENGMIDGLIYFDQLLDLVKGKLGVAEEDDVESIALHQYKDVEEKTKKEYSRDKIAVVYAMGTVVDGDAGEGFIGSERISRAIRKARRDKSVKAIVLRVNSGGGSMIASDVIYRESKLAADTKPFVVSMGDVAASGGYYISCPADTIIAGPTTITGSIGVFSVIANMRELMNEKLGITTDVVKTNEHADMVSVFKPLHPEVEATLQHFVDEAYGRFLEVVADGRDQSTAAIDEVAGGRVWSGKDALEMGLVDMLGGLEESIEVAASMAGLENYRVQSLPVLEDPLTMLMRELTGGASSRALKKELGPDYIHYRNIREIREMSGLQARMPFYLEVR